MPFLGIYCFAYLHCLHIYALYFKHVPINSLKFIR